MMLRIMRPLTILLVTIFINICSGQSFFNFPAGSSQVNLKLVSRVGGSWTCFLENTRYRTFFAVIRVLISPNIIVFTSERVCNVLIRIRIRGSGSPDHHPHHWITDPDSLSDPEMDLDPDPALFLNGFQDSYKNVFFANLYTYQRYIYTSLHR